MKIGMIVAVAREMGQLLAACGTPLSTTEEYGYTTSTYSIGENEIYVVSSGMGEIQAGSTCQYLVCRYHVDMIINFGVVGGLTPDMKLNNTVFVEKAVHYDLDVVAIDHTPIGQYAGYPDIYLPADTALLQKAMAACPEVRPVICASADKFVADPARKKELHELYAAEICDMESAGILLTANRCKVPALLIKAVSDSAEGGAEEFEKMIHSAAAACVKVLLRIIGA